MLREVNKTRVFMKIIKGILFNLIIISICMLSACGKSGDDEINTDISNTLQSYVEVETVTCSDVDVSLHIKLTTQGAGDKSYYADHEGMEVKNIPFNEGDIVHKGDVLVEFKSDDIVREITEAKNAIEQDRILYEHVLRLKNIYPGRDYSVDEAKLINDTEVNTARQREYEAWLEAYSIRATEDGVVARVSGIWQQSKVGTTDSLITVNYNNGIFKGSTEDEVELIVGGEYDATVGVATRRVIVDEITDEGTNENGQTITGITVHLADETPVSDKNIILDITKPVLKNAISIDKDSTVYLNNRYYVYVLDDNDIPILRKIDAWKGPDGRIIVTDGLSEGERLVSGL